MPCNARSRSGLPRALGRRALIATAGTVAALVAILGYKSSRTGMLVLRPRP